MSEFILPDDVRALAQQAADDISISWEILVRACEFKGYPLDIAQSQVAMHIAAGANEIHSVRNVYHVVMNS